MGFVLWIAAVVLVIVGIVLLFQDQIILGIVLIVLGFLVGPGGFSIFRTRTPRRSSRSSDDFWR
jgi:predicted cobalt transporter CbtA